jgi:hypothetical protein
MSHSSTIITFFYNYVVTFFVAAAAAVAVLKGNEILSNIIDMVHYQLLSLSDEAAIVFKNLK